MASTLDRYRKRGGFKQLLLLVETSNSKKQDSLLRVVETEDHRWAGMIRDRMLTLNKIFQWDGEAIEKVMSEFDVEIWVKSLFLVETSDERLPLAQKITKFMSGPQQKKVLECLDELNPTAAEVESIGMMLIKKARELQVAGHIKPEKFDAGLALSDLDDVL